MLRAVVYFQGWPLTVDNGVLLPSCLHCACSPMLLLTDHLTLQSPEPRRFEIEPTDQIESTSGRIVLARLLDLDQEDLDLTC